jgi:hypothetical protein
MRLPRTIAAAALLAALNCVAACDQTPAPAPPPASQPATQASNAPQLASNVQPPAGSGTAGVTSAEAQNGGQLVISADTQPAESFMTIDGKVYSFPRAMLRLRQSGSGVSALLYTDDPPAALLDNYTGNSYYLQMNLDIPDAARIGSAKWLFKAPSSERVDSPDGIFLSGHKIELQPLDVQVRFDGTEPVVTISLVGRFLLLNSVHEDVAYAPQFVNVFADGVMATVVRK